MNRWLAVSLLGLLTAGTAAAQVSDVADPVETRNGVRYACTGVGADSRQDPRWIGFPAKLVFAANGGGYLSQVRTSITDGQGRTVFEVENCGPWLLVDLPKGNYRVVATAPDARGQLHESRATMAVGGAAQSETIVRFPEVAG